MFSVLGRAVPWGLGFGAQVFRVETQGVGLSGLVRRLWVLGRWIQYPTVLWLNPVVRGHSLFRGIFVRRA